MRSGGFARSGKLTPRGTYSIADDARATFAAERDEQRRDWLASLWPAATVVAVVVTTLVYVFLLTKILPFRYWDAVCVVTMAIMPAELALACFFVQDHPVAVAAAVARAGARLKGPRGWMKLVPAAFLLGIMLPANGVLYLNQALDHSPAESQSLVVQRLWSHSNRHVKTWLAGVVPTARAPLRFAMLYSFEPIVVPRRIWRTLEPSRSTLTLAVHPGLLGLPWYERDPVAAP